MIAAPRLALASAITLALAAPVHAAPVPHAGDWWIYVTRGGVGFTGSVDIQMQYFDAETGGTPTTAASSAQPAIAPSRSRPTRRGGCACSAPSRSR